VRAALLGVALGLALAGPAGAEPGLAAGLDGHQAANPARVIDGHAPFADAPAFKVVTRKKDPDMHPCGECHEWTESDLKARELKEPHDNFRLQHGLHGKGEFWCFTCHHLKGKGGLRTLEGVRLPFDEAYVVCAQCHSQETRDWVFGAHGKRVGGWEGERVVLNCTVCHYQHSPAIGARVPQPPPPVRRGLARPAGEPARVERLWERHAAAAQEAR
jgi:hypothetical protein